MAIPKIDQAFEEDQDGMYLVDPSRKLSDHLVTLQAAFNITAEELTLVLGDSRTLYFKHFFDIPICLPFKEVEAEYVGVHSPNRG